MLDEKNVAARDDFRLSRGPFIALSLGFDDSRVA
jgi:hypothetical protein